MRFQFLGTAAAEAMPAIFCECEICKHAWEHGGKDVRRRASYLIDDDTLIDFGPDINWQINAFRIDLTKIKRIIFTHPHADHLDAIELYWRTWFSRVSKNINVFGCDTVEAQIKRGIAAYQEKPVEMKDLKINFIPYDHGVEVTDEDMTILPLKADHPSAKKPVFPIIRRNGKTILVMNDTGYPFEEDWELIEKEKFDLVTIDTTMALVEPDCRRNHMGVNVVAEVAERLRAKGCLKENCRIVSTHISHNSLARHADLEAFFTPRGIEVAYDGMIVEI